MTTGTQPTAIMGIMQTLLAQATERLQAHNCVVLLRDPETGMFQVVADSDRQSTPGWVVRPDEDMVSRVVLNGEPLIVNDYRQWVGRSLDLDPEAYAYDALLCVPLRWRGEMLGGLAATAASARRQFGPVDVPILQLYADVMAALLGQHPPRLLLPEAAGLLEREADAELEELRQARAEMAADADRLRRLLADTVALQEGERLRIARDLHDGANQLAVGATFEIQAAQQGLLSGHTEQALARLEQAKRLVRQIEQENRAIINGLRPPMLASAGLPAAVRHYLGWLSQDHQPAPQFEQAGEVPTLPPDVEITVFRIIQEAVGNSLQHAHAANVVVGLDFRPGMLTARIRDDGIGMAGAGDNTGGASADPTRASGFGLIGMRERALSIGAQLEVQSAAHEGTCVTLHVPLASGPDDEAARWEQRRIVRAAYTRPAAPAR